MNEKQALVLERLNEDLLTLEESLESQSREKYINVIVLGVPRSGTTLATQLVFEHMDLACTNNLMARFWRVPIVGCVLSSMILGDIKKTEYLSEYGTTKYPWEPHEFSWFWHDILGIRSIEKHGYPDSKNIDWDRARRKILALNEAMQSSFIHKPLELVGLYLDQFVGLLSHSLFVYIERDDLDVAYSLVQARKGKTGSIDNWWGSYPPGNKILLLKDEPYNVQIAGQILYLKEMYAQKLKCIPENRLIRTGYERLCNNPRELLMEINAKSSQLGCEVPINSLPEPESPLAREKRAMDRDIVDSLLQGFAVVENLYA